MTTDTNDARHTEKMQKMQAAKRRIMAEKTIEKGLLIINTGAGKGKTTAAFGMALRGIGHGMKVGIVQFVKGAMETGEQRAFAAFGNQLEFIRSGEGFTWDTQDRARDIAHAEAGWREVQRMLRDPAYGMVIADELNIALRYEYLPVADVIAAAEARPPMQHFVVTGRNAPDALMEAADLVTEMTLRKHPFRAGVKAQAGVEF